MQGAFEVIPLAVEPAQALPGGKKSTWYRGIMTRTQQLQSLSDEELLHNLSEILQQSRQVDAELVAHIGEVDDRRLFAREACSSLFLYFIEIFHLSQAPG